MPQPPDRPNRIVVVGAGVLGLSCALRLLQAGHRVDVLARDLPLETTSSVAAAIWYPYLAFPQDKVTAWGKTAYDEFARLAEQDADGVVMRRGTELLDDPTPDPWWIDAVPVLDRVEPRPPYRDAWSFVAPGDRHAALPDLAGPAGRGGGRHDHPDGPGRRCPRPPWS